MIKRLTGKFTTLAAGGGLLLMVLIAAAALGDRIDLALVGVGLLQVLVLGALLVTTRRSSAAAMSARAATAAELGRTISNIGLRSVDETRASERELSARIDALKRALEARGNGDRPGG